MEKIDLLISVIDFESEDRYEISHYLRPRQRC